MTLTQEIGRIVEIGVRRARGGGKAVGTSRNDGGIEGVPGDGTSGTTLTGKNIAVYDFSTYDDEDEVYG